MTATRFRSILFVVVLVSVAVPRSRAGEAPARKPLLTAWVHDRVGKILDQAVADGDFATAEKSAAELFDQVTLYAPDEKLDAFRDASFTLRVVTQLEQIPEDQRVSTLQYLRKNPDLASTLVFLIRFEQEKVDGVFAVLNRLREKHADELNKYANLTAALCIVRSVPLKDQINENKVEAADAVAVWEFYVANEGKLFFGLKNVPAELLEYVVDTTASVEDMQWALEKYHGDKLIARHFFDVKYDLDNFHKGTEKKVTTAGYTLPNILKYGGVCADQAYFATSIGKAIGVPTALTSGSSAEVGHAWVGFLESDGRNGTWNFNVGRYEAYQGVRGGVRDPQTHKRVPDSYVALLGQLIGTKPVDRQNCVALTDVALRLRAALKAKESIDTPAPTDCASSTLRPSPRKADATTTLGLIDLALHQCTGYGPTWLEIRDMAIDDQLTLADKRHWADLLLKLGASKYPDFTLAILEPMVQTVADTKEQDGLWKALLPLFKTRFDLSAMIMTDEAAMWETAQQPDKAGNCYMDIVQNYANAGPFVLKALDGAEKLLVSTNRSDKVLTLYEQTWKQIKPPQEMAQMFARQSCWYRVGKLYADKLKAAGKDTQAATVLAKIDTFGGPTPAAGK